MPDAVSPWPGLAPFTEDQSGLFHGRDAEVRTLTRLMERKALTVLFGQSGLGKSSLLMAGVFPRLRTASFCPIYLRLDHGESAPPPGEQVKAMVAEATRRAGTWTKPGAAKPGETLWEFFHHRDDRLLDARGHAVVPVLVFDQFEELFTLGAAAGAQRNRAVAFMSELAELVENRPSEQLVGRLEDSSDEMEAFDFSRTDYRVCIALREDYLPHLESLKTIMPALMENRMRLSRMNGVQALEAVVKPGAGLVTEEVARTIVEFVSGARGGSPERLAELDVEPPLLSVICRELDERRRAAGQAQITADLVTGNRREILTDFYQRSVADLPDAMRTFVEDRLLTKSGFRDNLALESALEFPGVARPLIDTLVDRRLLRIEDRLGVERVELTHDVLAEVIRASRDTRQERETREKAAAELAATQAQTAAARRELRRVRLVAIGCAVLALLAVGSAIFGYAYLQRSRVAESAARVAEATARAAEARALAAAETARLAEAKAQATGRLADSARSQGEKVMAFMIEDFYEELVSTGRVETALKLAEQAVAYYDSLPPELRSNVTARNRALALARLGMALRRQTGNNTNQTITTTEGRLTSSAQTVLMQAIEEFKKLREAGDTSEPTILGSAIAWLAHGEQVVITSYRESADSLKEAEGFLRPLLSSQNKPTRLKRLFAEILYAKAWRLKSSPSATSILEEARRLLEEYRSEFPADLSASVTYARVLNLMGSPPHSQRAEGKNLQLKALEVTRQVLNRQPGNLGALRVRAAAQTALASNVWVDERSNLLVAAEVAWEELVRLDPFEVEAVTGLQQARLATAYDLENYGRISEALAKYRQVASELGLPPIPESAGSSRTLSSRQPALIKIVQLEAARGNRAASAEALVERERIRFTTRVIPRLEALNEARTPLTALAEDSTLKMYAGDYDGVVKNAERAIAWTTSLLLHPEATAQDFSSIDQYRETARQQLAEALIMLGRISAAEEVLRDRPLQRADGIEIPVRSPPQARQLWLAYCLARQGRGSEALAIVEPMITSTRRYSTNEYASISSRTSFARALLVAAISQPADEQGRVKRDLALIEAENVLSRLSAEAKQLYDQKLLIAWVAEERAKSK